MVNFEEVIKDWLLAKDPLKTALTGTEDPPIIRIFTPIPFKTFKNNVGAAIEFVRTGWAAHTTGAIHMPVFTFKCYGGDALAKSASDVGRLLYDRINHANGAVASGRIVTAEVAGGGGLVKQPDTKFWADISIYKILIEG